MENYNLDAAELAELDAELEALLLDDAEQARLDAELEAEAQAEEDAADDARKENIRWDKMNEDEEEDD